MDFEHTADGAMFPKPRAGPPERDPPRSVDGTWADGSATELRRRRLIDCQSAHLPAVAQVFRATFPENPISQLGRAFVQALLGSMVGDGGVSLICVEDDAVIGFIFGVEDSRAYRRHLLKHHLGTLARRCLEALWDSPPRAIPLLQYAGSYLLSSLRPLPWRAIDQELLPAASLVFLGVTAAQRRQGLAGRLTVAFLERLAERGTHQVKLAVASSNHAARQFYLAHGFRLGGCYTTPFGGSAFRMIYDDEAASRSSVSSANFRPRQRP